MMFRVPFQPTVSAICPRCLQTVDMTSWEPRAHYLVRPAEVADLVHFAPPGMRFLHGRTWAEEVTRWLKEEFRLGRLAYQRERPRQDIWKSPLRTRHDFGGDCEDLTITTVSMLWQGGLAPQLRLGHLRQNGVCEGHAWVEGEDERGGFLIEATAPHLVRGPRPLEYVPLMVLQFGDPEQLPWRVAARLAEQQRQQQLNALVLGAVLGSRLRR